MKKLVWKRKEKEKETEGDTVRQMPEPGLQGRENSRIFTLKQTCSLAISNSVQKAWLSKAGLTTH